MKERVLIPWTSVFERSGGIATGRIILAGVFLGTALYGCGWNPSGGRTSASSPAEPSAETGPGVAGRDPLMEQGARFMALVTEHKKRLEADPNDSESLRFLGNANFDISRYDQARDYYLQYLRIHPKDPAVRTDLASAYYHGRQTEKAVSELRTVLTDKPNHAAALFNLGLILSSDRKGVPEAIKTWEALLAAHPDYPRAPEVRKQIAELKKKG